jgi:hypothetical protein
MVKIGRQASRQAGRLAEEVERRWLIFCWISTLYIMLLFFLHPIK